MRNYRVFGRVSKAPRRPFEKERIDKELRNTGSYGLAKKKELWRINVVLSAFRRTARTLLTLPENNQRRQIEGAALLRRCHECGFLEEGKDKLDYVLGLAVPAILERRLQTIVFKNRMACSVHQARCFILQRHIAVGGRICSTPSFIVRKGSEGTVAFADQSPLAPSAARVGRVKRVRANKKKAAAEKEE